MGFIHKKADDQTLKAQDKRGALAISPTIVLSKYYTNGDYRSGGSHRHPWPGSRGSSHRPQPLASSIEREEATSSKTMFSLSSVILFWHYWNTRSGFLRLFNLYDKS